MKFAKGHGTENDFVIVEDFEARNNLSPKQIRLICNRRAGIGGDGLLRVTRAGALEAAGEIDKLEPGINKDDWFMDYRNADGSVAEMCGNGTRVFAHWLRANNLVTADKFTIGTRAGAKPVSVLSCDPVKARVTVEMGAVEVLGISTAKMGKEKFAGLALSVGNPHLAAVIPNLNAEKLAAMDFVIPEFDTDFFPAGVNVEVLTPLQDGQVHMRVFERGVGETRSCGTGTVATACAALADAGRSHGQVTVNVPGGVVEVEIRENGSSLTGPSKIVAIGELNI